MATDNVMKIDLLIFDDFDKHKKDPSMAVIAPDERQEL